MSSLPFAILVSLAMLSGTAEGIARNQIKRSFTARDCGGQNPALRFNSISVTPHPLRMPGTIRIAVNIDIVRNTSETMSAKIEVARRVDFGILGTSWFDLTPPCLIGQKCRTDLCDIINNVVQTQGCPAEVIDNGFTCVCPPIAGSYVTRSDLPFVVEVRERDLPHQIVRDIIRGTYKMRASIYDGLGASVGCFEAEFGLE